MKRTPNISFRRSTSRVLGVDVFEFGARASVRQRPPRTAAVGPRPSLCRAVFCRPQTVFVARRSSRHCRCRRHRHQPTVVKIIRPPLPPPLQRSLRTDSTVYRVRCTFHTVFFFSPRPPDRKPVSYWFRNWPCT